MIKPLIGKISSGYGYRTNPITEAKELHGGIDIVPTDNDDIVFPLKGTVVAVGESKSFGKRIWVKINMPNHKYNGRFYVLAHLEEIDVKIIEGKKVNIGEYAGKCGSTGMSTGKHLHFEIANSVYVSRTSIEPLEFIEMYNENPVKTENTEDTQDKKEPVKEKKTKKEPSKNGNDIK